MVRQRDPELNSQKLAGVPIIIGSVLAIVANVLHPRGRGGGFVEPSVEDEVRLIANVIGGLWYPTHVVLVVFPPVLILGVLFLYKVLVERNERSYSLPAVLALGLSTSLFTIAFVMHGFLEPVLAKEYLGASAGAKELAAGIFAYNYLVELTLYAPGVFVLTLGLTLLSASLVKAKLYNKWFTSAGFIIGLFGVLGYIAGIFGPYYAFSPVEPPYVGVLSVWLLILGIFAYRAK